MNVVKRLQKTIAAMRDDDNFKAEMDRQAAQIEYLAIMSDVRIDESMDAEGEQDE